jgi:hypothetical protein
VPANPFRLNLGVIAFRFSSRRAQDFCDLTCPGQIHNFSPAFRNNQSNVIALLVRTKPPNLIDNTFQQTL